MRFQHPHARQEKKLHPIHAIGDGKINSYMHNVVHLANPDPDTVCIEDIAHALSNICRFGGHTKEFYSVAQHSCLVSYLAPAHLRLEALLHDAAEAYLGDVVKPLKVLMKQITSPATLDGYAGMEARFQRLIGEKFNIDPKAFALVKPFDTRALEIEHGYFFLNEENPFSKLFNSLEPCWTPRIAEETFMSTFKELYHEG
jgi:hypothetical protein